MIKPNIYVQTVFDIDYKKLKEKGIKLLCFDLDNTLDVPDKVTQNKDEKIVVYCSLGVRSETIGIKLKEAGYTNILNLYGGIFEWKNQNFDVYSNTGNKTENVHAYSKTWSKWLLKGNKILD